MRSLFDEEVIQRAYGKEKYEEGKVEGKIEGETCLGSLIEKLYVAGRPEEIRRAATDATFRNQLYQEFSIL